MEVVSGSIEGLEDSPVQDAVIVGEEFVLHEADVETDPPFATSVELDFPDDLPEPSLAHRLWTELAVLRERLRATQMIAIERESRIQDLRLILQMVAAPSDAGAPPAIVVPEAESIPVSEPVFEPQPPPDPDAAIWERDAGTWSDDTFTEVTAPDPEQIRPWIARDPRADKWSYGKHEDRRRRRQWFRLWRR